MYNPTPPPAPYGGKPVPRSQMRLTHAERDQVAEVLREAYAQGQLDEDEFDERLGRTMSAKLHGELEPLVADLSPAVPGGVAGATPMAGPEGEPTKEERGWALGAHVSGYFSLGLGPLLVLLAKGDSPFVRRQAFQALNYQLIFLIATVTLPITMWLLFIPLVIYVFMAVGWVFLPLIAGIAAALGNNWRYPLTYQIIKDPRAR
ncbi:DUF1707 and DUF4870 domain-containing protein [Actinorugispora endophytica]|uniref:DUF1707 and DUF4870 domain-containing protein n=1 Tax=Actinorugispora endophytica TaxID=1605990 RepID=UPI001FB7BB3C|nr:DUF1707 and DUF4870 domain-containing protein [Actinorugispora endophytica]